MTAENPFNDTHVKKMFEAAKKGIKQITKKQREALKI
jgi:ribonuclease PH